MKNIKVSDENWKKLVYLKVEKKKKNIDEVISELIKKYVFGQAVKNGEVQEAIHGN